jgi:hypothetical protein
MFVNIFGSCDFVESYYDFKSCNAPNVSVIVVVTEIDMIQVHIIIEGIEGFTVQTNVRSGL